MVSEKIVVILMIMAIVLSVISVTITVLTINMKMTPSPTVNIIRGEPDSQQGQLSIVINPPIEKT